MQTTLFQIVDHIEAVEHKQLGGQDYYLDSRGKVWTWNNKIQKYTKVNHAGRIYELGWNRK